jgi:hypothetical protein
MLVSRTNTRSKSGIAGKKSHQLQICPGGGTQGNLPLPCDEGETTTPTGQALRQEQKL